MHEGSITWATGFPSEPISLQILEEDLYWTKVLGYEITTLDENFLALTPAERYLVAREDGSIDIVQGRLEPRVCYLRTAEVGRMAS